jgi:uncharacterized protein YcnI
MKKTFIATLLAFTSTTLLVVTSVAQAHITLDEPQALAGTAYKAAFRVGHGCNGSATQRISVRIPAGFMNAKPIPKPGWTIEIRRAPLAEPYESQGKTITEDVVEITWKANSRATWLQDAWYDEFVVRGQTPAQPGPLWFKVLQQCEKGQSDWSEVPVSGTSTTGLKAPAALLEVLPDEHAEHAEHAGHVH